MEKILKRSLLTLTLAGLSSTSMAAVEFHILDAAEVDASSASWLRQEVANDGSVLTPFGDQSDLTYQKWHKSTGYAPYSTPGWALGHGLSNDGRYSLLTSKDLADGVRYYTPDGMLLVSSGNMSGDGRLITSGSCSYAPEACSLSFQYDGEHLNGEIYTALPDGTQASPLYGTTNNSGDRTLVHNNHAYYFLDIAGLFDNSSLTTEYTLIPYEFNNVSALSDDGHAVLATIKNYSTGCGESNVVYHDTNGITEISCKDEFSVQGFSGDGSKVIMTSRDSFWSPAESYIWDANNGIRNIKDILQQNGTNISDWSVFRATDISEDGTKITGWGTNPQDESYTFMIEVVAECTADF